MNIERRVFWFNPDCEIAVANESPYYTPPASIVSLAGDLGYLPAYFAGKDDLLLLERKPDRAFMESRKSIFGLLNRIVTWEELESLEHVIPTPWGWSPRSCHLLRALHPPVWNTEQKGLYSRKTARDCLAMLCERLPFVNKNVVPRVCFSIEEVMSEIVGVESVVKAPWSSSGRGLLKTGKEGLVGKNAEWIGGILKKQGYVMVENWLDKIYDFAMEFRIGEKGKVDFIGLSAFQTGEEGEYLGNYVGLQRNIEDRLVSYIGKEQYYSLKQEVVAVLSDTFPSKYSGYLGVDMMIYRNEAGKYCVQPCVEINMRYNMGILAIFLSERYIAPESTGMFAIHRFSEEGGALRFHSGQLVNKPLKIENRKIISGYVNLTPVTLRSRFVASLLLDRS